jgi:hypothetical protein
MKCDFCKEREAIPVSAPGLFRVKADTATLSIAIWKTDKDRMEPLVICLPCLKGLLGGITKTS